MMGRSGLDRRMFLRLSGAAGLGGFSGVASATPGRDPGPKPTEWIVGVGVGRNRPQQEVDSYLPSSASVVHENDTIGYAAVELPGDEEITTQTHQALSEAISDSGPVKYVEKNETYHAQFLPNDPRYEDQYAAEAVSAPTAWEETLGSSDVTIALVDQGVQYDHPDLEPNMASSPGRDFVDGDNDPYPEDPSNEPHGTHVAGIAGANTDNDQGVSGISDSTLLSARVLNQGGWGSVSDIADGIEWAVDQGADIINLSLGGGGRSQTMQNAVTYASSNGAFVVVAAGNSGSGETTYPAAYDECVAVSALDPDESLASYSNYGDAIELTAPGTNVVSTWTEDGYNSASGTSMATPVVSGVAALTLAQYDLTNEELRTHLRNTAVDTGLPETKQGVGRVDAGAAITTQPGETDGSDSTPESDTQPDPADSETGSGRNTDGGGSGIESTTTDVSGAVSDSKPQNYFSYGWGYDSPSKVVITLTGPSDADLDLYVIDGRDILPTGGRHDYSGQSSNSHERITIEPPKAIAPLYATVDSFSGVGEFTLSFEEFA
ncbi:S8 family peptidase [Halocatena pleomorpha]|uniref:Peptidase S8 n=1 Tax=Halocatena pleomorpha TaxID=1785090 RepID=A0A3P3RC50_9EURY|nr:S8 family peptidase [Halocatena pleomorpha]RRJ30549.1 peptidase S8 [Halocatena pleomorpha]